MIFQTSRELGSMLIFRDVPNLRIPYVSCGMTISTTPGTAQPAAGLEIREAKGMGVYVKAQGSVIFQRGRTGAGPENYNPWDPWDWDIYLHIEITTYFYSKWIQYHLMYIYP